MDANTLTGQVLAGRYRIDELVGQGSVSAVYKAYDTSTGQIVAVKAILAGLAGDSRFQERFDETTAAMAQLRHPNIVRTLDHGHDEDLYYLVQEFVPGETLQERLRRLNKAGKRMSVAEATEYAIELSDAAGYAHQKGMLHRDIRPANIMLDVHDQAILMDLGMVQMSGGRRHTATSAVIDTATYMPPEITRGEAPDPRSDIYSLGVTLYEIISGHPPFEASSVMTLLMMHLRDPVPDLREVRSEVPAALWGVLSEALAKDRDERYASMADLGLALQAIGEPLPSSAVPKLQATVLDMTGATFQATQPGAPSQGAARTGAVQAAGAAATLEAVGQPVAAATRLETGSQPVAPATRLETGSQPVAAATRLETGSQPVAAATRLEAGSVPLTGATTVQRPSNGSSLRRLDLEPLPEEAGSPAQMPAREASGSGILRRRWVWGAAAVVLLLLGAGLAFALTHGSGSGSKPPENVAGSSAPEQGTAAPASAAPGVVTATMPEGDHTGQVAGTGTMSTTNETMTMTMTMASPTGPISVTITSVTLDSDGHYVVNYQTHGLPENLTSVHLHFFFNTVPPEQAGTPYPVRWIQYFGQSPFTGYTAADRPPNASQLCVTAVNPNYTPLVGTGSCGLLPDVALASSAQGMDAYFGPGKSYPVVGHLEAGKQALILGLSNDELWWQVVNPENPDETYWIYTVDTQVTGDVSKVPLVEGPPPGATPPHGASIDITGITLDAQGEYVVDFVTEGFVPVYPGGTHIHFYFNTFTEDQVGIGGDANRRSHGGPPPFTGYATADRPAGATELCAVVANPDHSVIPNSGDCYPLPDLPTIQITGITLDAQGLYVVDFVASNFVPVYPGGTHIHFYFNTFTEDQVGIGGDANRRSHGGPPPFTGYAAADRPQGATELCAVVANPDHSVIPGSGNCFPLPDLPKIEITGITLDAQGLYVVDFVASNFVPVYPGGTHIHFYFNTFTEDQVGIGGDANRRSHGGPPPFTGYAAADRPAGATELCAVVANPDHSVIPGSGNCYPLPGLPTIKLTGITLDAQGKYVVDFVASNFVPVYPGGTHIHFYFNTFTEDQVGIGGEANRRSHGGPPPFTGYAAADRPQGATELCAVVANPDHSVIPNSGSCYRLPDVLGVEITGITVNAQNRYVVEYQIYGFTPGYPGTHVHFFYDMVKPEDVGRPGVPDKYYYGKPPFARFSVAGRPAGATKLCAIVATQDDTMIQGSGNCFELPN